MCFVGNPSTGNIDDHGSRPGNMLQTLTRQRGHVVLGEALSMGCVGSGGSGLAGAVFPGQESSGVRLRKGSDNQLVVGVGVWQGAGWGGHSRCPK